MQCAMSVSLLLLLTVCVSRSIHVSSLGTWAVITLRETIGYVDITCVIFIVSYDNFFWGVPEDKKQHLSCILTNICDSGCTTRPLH